MSFDSLSTGAAGGGKDVDAELLQFVEIEKAKAQYQAQVHKFTDLCWDVCVDKPGAKMDSRTETCLVNCVERYPSKNLIVFMSIVVCVPCKIVYRKKETK